jgi:hypothetical protein
MMAARITGVTSSPSASKDNDLPLLGATGAATPE